MTQKALANTNILFFITFTGRADNFASYRFENYYQIVKKWVKKPQKILQQILNKWHDLLFKGYNMQRNKFDQQAIITKKAPNNCILMNDASIIIIEDIESKDGEEIYFGKHYSKTEHFFVDPVGSKTLGIHKVIETNLSQETFEIDKKRIRAKCMKLPIFEGKTSDIECNSYVVYPILHYFS